MNDHHERREPSRVREPVQVYLDEAERTRLERLTRALGTTMSDVLRRGLEALERELSDPAHHPALSIVGIAHTGRAACPDERDPAREHDALLSDTEPGVGA